MSDFSERRAPCVSGRSTSTRIGTLTLRKYVHSMQSPQLDHDHKILEACCGALIIQLDGDECSVKEECMPMRPLDIKDATHILKTDESHGFPQQLAPFLTGEMHGAVKEDVWRIIHNFDIRNFTDNNPHLAAVKKAIAALKDRVGIRDLAEEEVASMDELKISRPPAVLHQCTADFGLAYRTVLPKLWDELSIEEKKPVWFSHAFARLFLRRSELARVNLAPTTTKTPYARIGCKHSRVCLLTPSPPAGGR